MKDGTFRKTDLIVDTIMALSYNYATRNSKSDGYKLDFQWIELSLWIKIDLIFRS